MAAGIKRPLFLLAAPPADRSGAALRIAKRRPTYLATAGSYVFDSAVLALYAYLGATGVGTTFIYLTFGLTTIGAWLLLSEIGFNERFRDHYLTVPQAFVGVTVQLCGIVLAPEVGVYFLLLVFVVLGFAALRLTARQTAYVWTFASLGLALVLMVVGDKLDLPMHTPAERAVALVCIVTALARCASAGLYGNGLREALYKRTHELESARARIEQLAYRDELTGASNRRDILRALDEQIARVSRGLADCTLAIVDLDHFKRVNDRYGHAAGDEVLKTFAITAYANLRSTDKIGRYGGEEFLLVMPDAPYAESVRAIERLRVIMAGLDWSSIARDLGVTMSAGITRVTATDTAEAIMLRADAALYRAKNQGRNRAIAT